MGKKNKSVKYLESGFPGVMEPNADLGITQSIFRPASRRETLGEHTKGDRRDGDLKMGWTKPLGCGVAYGY